MADANPSFGVTDADVKYSEYVLEHRDVELEDFTPKTLAAAAVEIPEGVDRDLVSLFDDLRNLHETVDILAAKASFPNDPEVRLASVLCDSADAHAMLLEVRLKLSKIIKDRTGADFPVDFSTFALDPESRPPARLTSTQPGVALKVNTYLEQHDGLGDEEAGGAAAAPAAAPAPAETTDSDDPE